MIQPDRQTIAMLNRLEVLVRELQSTNSSSDKIHLLSKHNEPNLKKLYQYVYSPYITFGITYDKVVSRCGEFTPKAVTSNLFEFLDLLRYRKLTGYDAYAALLGFMSLYPRHKEEIAGIVNKDLNVRIGAKTVNKAFFKLVPEFNVALAEDYFDHKHKVNFNKDRWLMSRKMDGVRVICVYKPNSVPAVTFYSRNGLVFNIFGKLAKIMEEICRANKNIICSTVFDGEMCLATKDGKDDFKGIVSAIHRKDYEVENPRYCIFDCISLDDFISERTNRNLSIRQHQLEIFVQTIPEKYRTYIKMVNQYEVKSEEMMLKNLDRAVELGWEGLIVRKDTCYQGKRSTDMLKVKKFKEEEFEVIRTENGPFKVIDENTGLEKVIETLSAVKIMYKENEVSVGSGFTLDQRKEYYKHPERIIGKQITVQYQGESEDKEGNKSLRFPTLKCVWEKGKRDV